MSRDVPQRGQRQGSSPRSDGGDCIAAPPESAARLDGDSAAAASATYARSTRTGRPSGATRPSDARAARAGCSAAAARPADARAARAGCSAAAARPTDARPPRAGCSAAAARPADARTAGAGCSAAAARPADARTAGAGSCRAARPADARPARTGSAGSRCASRPSQAGTVGSGGVTRAVGVAAVWRRDGGSPAAPQEQCRREGGDHGQEPRRRAPEEEGRCCQVIASRDHWTTPSSELSTAPSVKNLSPSRAMPIAKAAGKPVGDQMRTTRRVSHRRAACPLSRNRQSRQRLTFVELNGIEPSASSMPLRRSPS